MYRVLVVESEEGLKHKVESVQLENLLALIVFGAQETQGCVGA